MSQSGAVVMLTTCPNEACAKTLAMQLLEQHLAAGINIIPGMTSCYWWQGAIQTEAEWLLLMYTQADNLPAIEALFAKQHPYEVPALVMLPITDGAQPFLQWIQTHASLA